VFFVKYYLKLLHILRFVGQYGWMVFGVYIYGNGVGRTFIVNSPPLQATDCET